MAYRHISNPIFKFGQPDVKWIEIDDSIVEPYSKVGTQNKTLVFIDTEWGPRNIPVEINSKKEFTEIFGMVPNLEESLKGVDYLSQNLAYNLQGSVPLYVVRVQYPFYDDDLEQYFPIDFYRQKSGYEFKRFINLLYQVDFSEQITVTNEQGTLTYVLDTDYSIVSGKSGIYIKKYGIDPTDSIIAGSNIKITYTRQDNQFVKNETVVVPYPYENFIIKQKHPGLFGQNFQVLISYDPNFKAWNQDVGLVTEFIPQTNNVNSDYSIYDSFTQGSLTELLSNINQYSLWVDVYHYICDSQVNYIQLPQSDVIDTEETFTVKNQEETITYVQGLDYLIDFSTNKVFILTNKQENGIYIDQVQLKISYTTTEPITVSQLYNVPGVTLVTQDTEEKTILYRLQKYNGLKLEISSLCLECLGEDGLYSRLVMSNYNNYFDQISIGQIYEPGNATDNILFNSQKSMDVNFNQILTDLVQNYSIDNPEDYQISFVCTLGLNKHSFFQE